LRKFPWCNFSCLEFQISVSRWVKNKCGATRRRAPGQINTLDFAWSRTLMCAQQEMLKRTPDLYNVQRK
jgi:hypothetical protein